MAFAYRDGFLTDANAQSRLSDENLLTVLDTPGRLTEPTRTVIGYVCDVSALLKGCNLEQRYGIFGGYGALAQLVGRFGDQVIQLWRGSEDIDMFGCMDVLNTLRDSYDVFNDRPSPNIADKVTLKLRTRDGTEDGCKTDFVLYQPGEKPPYDTEAITVLGVPVMAATPLHLIKSKLEPALSEEKQFEDVESMLGVLEYRGLPPRELAGYLGVHDASKLYGLLSQRQYDWGGRMNTGPSDRYTGELLKELRGKRKAVTLISKVQPKKPTS